MWGRTGSNRVDGDVKAVQSQFTGDIAHNMLGEIVGVLTIWDGDTTGSEPSAALQAKYAPRGFQYVTIFFLLLQYWPWTDTEWCGLVWFGCSFMHTKNHWANHDTKVAWVKTIWKWVLARYQSDNLTWTPEQVKQNAQCMLLLDCWPTNLTDLFRKAIKEECPGMELCFIPAGSTGRFQVTRTTNTFYHQLAVTSRRW